MSFINDQTQKTRQIYVGGHLDMPPNENPVNCSPALKSMSSYVLGPHLSNKTKNNTNWI